MSNAIINEPDRVVLVGEWGSEVVYGVMYSGTENKAEFDELFEIPAWSRNVLGDPNEDFYQGMTFMSLIMRKSDGKLFGYKRWENVAKYNDYEVEPNGDEHGFESTFDEDNDWAYLRGPYWVWLPVMPFMVTGYWFGKDS